MTDAEPGAGRQERDHERCPQCDPGLLDELKCKAEGIQKQAEYNAEHGQELDDARTAFMAARAAYNAVRSEAKPLVADAHRQLEELEDRVRCQLDSDDAERIDIETAFGRVVERLNRCGHTRGCCCDEDCDYDDEVRDCDPDEVSGRLAVIKHRTEEAAECFWSLIGEHTVVPTPESGAPAAGLPAAAAPAEATADTAAAAAPATPATPAAAPAAPATPAAAAAAVPAVPAVPATPAVPAPAASATPAAAAAADAPATAPDTPLAALPARVKALQDEIAAISKAAADGSWEPAKLYAAVLVARRHLRNVWRGFSNVNEYMECLCRALTCMIKGHAAIGELTRQDAVNQCYRESWKAACEHLEHHTVEEVLAEYLRVWEERRERREDREDRREDREDRREDREERRERREDREERQEEREDREDRREDREERRERREDQDHGEHAERRPRRYRDPATGRYIAP